jgi:nuclear-control-of-ATPase protein 2
VAQAVRSTREFFLEHVSEPSRAIAKELIWNEHESITDVAALEDAKESLARMLADFVRDTNPKLPEEERRALAANMDMSVVSSRYEQSLPQAMRHIINGEIVRMLLIQVQFIKKELLVAMRGIDDVMNR